MKVVYLLASWLKFFIGFMSNKLQDPVGFQEKIELNPPVLSADVVNRFMRCPNLLTLLGAVGFQLVY